MWIINSYFSINKDNFAHLKRSTNRPTTVCSKLTITNLLRGLYSKYFFLNTQNLVIEKLRSLISDFNSYFYDVIISIIFVNQLCFSYYNYCSSRANLLYN